MPPVAPITRAMRCVVEVMSVSVDPARGLDDHKMDGRQPNEN
jgi:hypothetical protein